VDFIEIGWDGMGWIYLDMGLIPFDKYISGSIKCG
jgi:hypothetical protein